MSIRLPRNILRNVRLAELARHRLYSQGSALFVCRYCGQSAFLDTMNNSLMRECTHAPVIPMPSEYKEITK